MSDDGAVNDDDGTVSDDGTVNVDGAVSDDGTDDTVRVWLVERTYSDDEQNLIILTYATPDGRHDYRKERALTSFSGDARPTTAALDVEPHNLGDVDDPETRERYRAEVERVQKRYDPDEAV